MSLSMRRRLHRQELLDAHRAIRHECGCTANGHDLRHLNPDPLVAAFFAAFCPLAIGLSR